MFDDKCSFCTYIVLEMFALVHIMLILLQFCFNCFPKSVVLFSCPSSSIGGPVTDWLNDSLADGL